MLPERAAKITLPGKVNAVGLWNGFNAAVLHHQGAVFSKLARGRRGRHLLLSEAEAVYALMRTLFLLLDVNTLERITAEGIIKDALNSGEYERLLRVHVYLAAKSLNMAPKPALNDIQSRCDRMHQHGPAEMACQSVKHTKGAGSSISQVTPSIADAKSCKINDSVTATLKADRTEHIFTKDETDAGEVFNIKEEKWERLDAIVKEAQAEEEKLMPYEIMERFKSICGSVYPIAPLTIEEPLFYLDGVPLYGVTADAVSTQLLRVIPSRRMGEPPLQGSVAGSNADDCCVENATSRCIIAVSNFDSVYFLNLGCNKRY